MSRRLQVLLEEDELRGIQRLARRRGVSTAEWVRGALRAASEEELRSDPRPKLAAIRRAARLAYPTADIDTMLAEIERGRSESDA